MTVEPYPCCSHCNAASMFPCFQKGRGHPVPCAIPTCPGAELQRVGCNGLCLTGYDIGIPSGAIAAAHPECDLHGQHALYEVDGTPRRTEEIS